MPRKWVNFWSTSFSSPHPASLTSHIYPSSPLPYKNEILTECNLVPRRRPKEAMVVDMVFDMVVRSFDFQIMHGLYRLYIQLYSDKSHFDVHYSCSNLSTSGVFGLMQEEPFCSAWSYMYLLSSHVEDRATPKSWQTGDRKQVEIVFMRF